MKLVTYKIIGLSHLVNVAFIYMQSHATAFTHLTYWTALVQVGQYEQQELHDDLSEKLTFTTEDVVEV